MKISVIIPTLNEESCLARTIDRLWQESPAEVIVSDGGSEDGTVRIALQHATVLRVCRGRAVQQNAGAFRACGDAVLFLHADCWLESGWQEAIRRALSRPGCIAGCFRMCIDAEGWLYRAIERGGDLRARWFGLPYGDQGIFMLRETFHRLGGFPPVAFMEDLLFMRRARRFGRIAWVPLPIHISPRRWQRTRILRQTLRNWTLTALAVWGNVHPDRLRDYYPDVR